MPESMENELLNPHCGNQFLHLAEYALVTLRSLDTVAEKGNVSKPRMARTLEEAAIDITSACMRLLVIAVGGSNAIASTVMSEAMLSGKSLHEAWSNHLPENLN